MNIDDTDDIDRVEKNNKRQNILDTLYHSENVLGHVYRISYNILLIILIAFSSASIIGAMWCKKFIFTNCLMQLVEVINALEWSSITLIVTIIGIRMISNYILLYYNNRQ